MYDLLTGGIATLLYCLAALLLALRLSRAGEAHRTSKLVALLPAGLAVVLHAMILTGAVLQPNGLNLGFFNALSLAGWLIAAVLFLVALVKPVESLGILLMPFAALTVLLELVFTADRIVVDINQWPLEVHILLSLLAYSLLALAAVQALLLAVQEHRLHARRPGGFIRGIPPLMTMESLLFQLLAAGFVLLSLALLSGALFVEDLLAQHLVHKTVLTTLAWLVFGILLWGRWRFGWRGKTAIRWTLTGFAVLVLGYFGSKLVLELVLKVS